MLTPAKEALWRKWIALYSKNMLPKGAVSRRALRHRFRQARSACRRRKDGALYYAFYADRWSGPIALRGLGKGEYRADRLLHRRVARHRDGGGHNSLDAQLRALPAARGNARRERRHDALLQRRSGRAWLINALDHGRPVGRLGRVHRTCRRSTAFPDTLVYCVWAVTMIPPAFIALAQRRLASSTVEPRRSSTA